MEREEIIQAITVKIDRKLWEKFKSLVFRDRTLNEAVVDLIRKEVQNAK